MTRQGITKAIINKAVLLLRPFASGKIEQVSNFWSYPNIPRIETQKDLQIVVLDFLNPFTPNLKKGGKLESIRKYPTEDYHGVNPDFFVNSCVNTMMSYHDVSVNLKDRES